MGFVQDAIARARKKFKEVDIALGGRLPGGVTPEEARRPQIGKPIITPKEAEAGARGQVVDITKKPSELVPEGVVSREPSKDVFEKIKTEKEAATGRAITDVEAEVKLREQGFMTIQYGTDETGFPLTRVISIEGFKEESLAAQKAEAELTIDILMRGAAATPGAIMATRTFRGISGKSGQIGTISKTGVQVNAKTATQTKSILSRFFSKKALALYGAWAGAVTIGKWGFAEAAEGITFPTSKFLIPEAQRTGDWTAVDEANALAEEITDISIWEKIALWTPLAPFIGIPKKIQGAAAGIAIQTKFTEDQKVKQALGQTEAQYWEQRAEDEAEQDKFAVDYYNEERKKMIEWEREAEIQGRNEDAAFWRDERVRQMKLEAEDRQAIADFWTAYKKESQKIIANSRPSNLNFGLL